MRSIVWSTDAAIEIRETTTYIAHDDPVAAEMTAAHIRHVVQDLAAMPTGRKDCISGTHEKVVSGLPYFVAYALADEPRDHETITILRIIHGARNWPD